MSTSTAKRSTSSTKPATPKYTSVPVEDTEVYRNKHITPTTQPIPNPLTTVGRAYTHIHPVLVLLNFARRFKPLVADPVSALLRDLVVLGIAQAAYAVICLPPTTATTSIKALKGDGEKEKPAARRAAPSRGKKRDEVGMGTRISTALLSLILSLFAATPVLFAGLVLLGGPLTTHHSETLLCAAHIAMLAAPPLFYTRGVDPRAWREVIALLLPGDAIWGGSLGALIGAWLGAVPIPLDWDRDWQRWPVTIVAGAYAGWAVGRLLGEFVFAGKRVPMEGE